MSISRITRWALAGAVVATGAGALATPGVAIASSGAHELVGTFKLAPGVCSAFSVSGSYFRMITRGGTSAHPSYFPNPDSKCSNQTYSLATAGVEGGIETGRYQPNPKPAFTKNGSARADDIIIPDTFTAIGFSVSTNRRDPQTGVAVPPPSIIDRKGKLSGQVEALSVAWNNLYFNQGSPKPGGGRPGDTKPVTGTYNAKTHAFVLTWTSQIVGGPFTGFTGYWHLAGTFVPAGK